jgi:hypothetical protein
MWAKVEGIRTSTFFFTLSCGLIACAKGTEISPSEIVVIQPLAPQDAPDASADAAAPAEGVAPAEPTPEAASGE